VEFTGKDISIKNIPIPPFFTSPSPLGEGFRERLMTQRGITPSLRSGVIPGEAPCNFKDCHMSAAHMGFYLRQTLAFASKARFATNKNRRLLPAAVFEVAERGGFEPPVPLTQNNGFRDRRIRPLCHLSKISQSHSPRSLSRSA
jgi:hypothetical protein